MKTDRDTLGRITFQVGNQWMLGCLTEEEKSNHRVHDTFNTIPEEQREAFRLMGEAVLQHVQLHFLTQLEEYRSLTRLQNDALAYYRKGLVPPGTLWEQIIQSCRSILKEPS